MSDLPQDPWRTGTGDTGVDLLYEGAAISDALDAFEDDPAGLAPALAVLTPDDCRAALFSLVMQGWIDRAVGRQGRLMRASRRLRAMLEHAGSWLKRPPLR
jgi:hypothetical protein